MEKTIPVWQRRVTVDGAKTRGWHDFEDWEEDDLQAAKNQRTVAKLAERIGRENEGIAIESAGVQIGERGYAMVDIHVAPEVMPFPFSYGVTVSGCSIPPSMKGAKADVLLVEYYAKVIGQMLRRTQEALDSLQAVHARAMATTSQTGIEVRAIQIRRVYAYNGSDVPKYQCLVETGIVDEDLTDTSVIYDVEAEKPKTFSFLSHDARQQAKRRRRRNMGEHVDITLWHALQKMKPEALRALYDLLRKHKNASGYATNQWTAKQCLDAGIELPAEIETIKTKDGILTGRVRLSPELIYNRNRFTAAITLPETVRNGAIGRPLGDVLQHPWLPHERPVLKCEAGQGAKTYITIEPLLVTLDGTPAGD